MCEREGKGGKQDSIENHIVTIRIKTHDMYWKKEKRKKKNKRLEREKKRKKDGANKEKNRWMMLKKENRSRNWTPQWRNYPNEGKNAALVHVH